MPETFGQRQQVYEASSSFYDGSGGRARVRPAAVCARGASKYGGRCARKNDLREQQRQLYELPPCEWDGLTVRSGSKRDRSATSCPRGWWPGTRWCAAGSSCGSDAAAIHAEAARAECVCFGAEPLCPSGHERWKNTVREA